MTRAGGSGAAGAGMGGSRHSAAHRSGIVNRTDRLNRIVLAVTGLIVLLLGLGGLLLGSGTFGTHREHESVIYPAAVRLLRRHEGWVWWAIGGAALLLALLELWWLVLQLRIERLNSVPVERTLTGDSMLPANALTDAVVQETEAVPGVRRARAHLVGDGAEPELAMTVWLRDGADIGEVRHALDAEVVSHARDALGHQRLRAWLRIEVDTGKRERVR